MNIIDFNYDDSTETLELCIDIDQTDGHNGKVSPVWRTYSIDHFLPYECQSIEDGAFMVPVYEGEEEYMEGVLVEEDLKARGSDQILFEAGLLKRYHFSFVGKRGYVNIFAENRMTAAAKFRASNPDQGFVIEGRPTVYPVAEVLEWNTYGKTPVQVTLVSQEVVLVA